MNRNCPLILLIVLCGFLFGGCRSQPSQLLPKAAHEEFFDGAGDWKKNLRFWLGIGYHDDGTEASFAFVPVDLVRKPSFYSTFAVVGIYTELESQIENAQPIADWIRSLQTPQGMYHNPHEITDHPLIMETFWAIKTLKNLHVSVENSEKTIESIRALQAENGLFHAPELGEEEEDDLVATYYAVETFGLLELDLAQQAFLEKTEEALKQYLSNATTVESIGASVSDASSFFMAMYILTKLEPKAITPTMRLALRSGLEQIPSLPGGIHTIVLANQVLDVVQLVDPSMLELERENLRRYTEEAVNQGLARNAQNKFRDGSFQPMVMYQSIRLLQHAGATMPFKLDLNDALDRYRISNGWVVFVDAQPDPFATYAALTIASETGADAFNAEKVGVYLSKFIDPKQESFDLGRSAVAAEGLLHLNQKLDPALLENLQQRAQKEIERSPKEGARLRMFGYVQLAEVLRWKIPVSLQERIKQTLGASVKEIETSDMQELYISTVLASSFDFENISKEHIQQRVMSLWMKEGGFKLAEPLTSADMRSTYQAVQTLKLVGAEKNIDWAGVKRFVLSCQDDFGFNSVPHALIGGASNGYNLTPDLISTQYAFQLLSDVERMKK